MPPELPSIFSSTSAELSCSARSMCCAPGSPIALPQRLSPRSHVSFSSARASASAAASPSEFCGAGDRTPRRRQGRDARRAVRPSEQGADAREVVEW